VTDSEITANRRKRLKFRSWHRGTREMDLILGRFADAHIDAMTADQLDRYAALLENSDPDIYDWLTDRAAPPPAAESDVLQLLRRFKVHEAKP
jgi:antitoxin CptB